MNRRNFVKGLLGITAGALGLSKMPEKMPPRAMVDKGCIQDISCVEKVECGKIRNCLLIAKKNQIGPIFTVTEDARGTIIPNLNGYAIVPIEILPRRFWKLQGLAAQRWV